MSSTSIDHFLEKSTELGYPEIKLGQNAVPHAMIYAQIVDYLHENSRLDNLKGVFDRINEKNPRFKVEEGSHLSYHHVLAILDRMHNCLQKLSNHLNLILQNSFFLSLHLQQPFSEPSIQVEYAHQKDFRQLFHVVHTNTGKSQRYLRLLNWIGEFCQGKYAQLESRLNQVLSLLVKCKRLHNIINQSKALTHQVCEKISRKTISNAEGSSTSQLEGAQM